MKELSNDKLMNLIKSVSENHDKTKIQIISILDKIVENEINIKNNVVLIEGNEKLLSQLILLDELKKELEEKYFNIMQELKNRGIFNS